MSQTTLEINYRAFAMIKQDGTVVSWGEVGRGGSDVPLELTDTSHSDFKLPQTIYCNWWSFAVLREDGTVRVWGHPRAGGTTSNGTDSYGNDYYGLPEILTDSSLPGFSKVINIYSTGFAYAALKEDGKVIAWGDVGYGGAQINGTGYTGYACSLADGTGNTKSVVRLYPSQYSFLAVTSNDDLIEWGKTYGTNTISIPTGLKYSDIQTISSGAKSFAALKNDGTVVTWGSANEGGDSSSVQNDLTNIQAVYTNGYTYAALKNDGTVVVWGTYNVGGSTIDYDRTGAVVDAPGEYVVGTSHVSDIKEIFGNMFTYAAVKNDGTVVAWGQANFGAHTSNYYYYPPNYPNEPRVLRSVGIPSDLTDVNTIYSNGYAYVVLKNDGSVAAWGGWMRGGDVSAVQDDLINVQSIACNLYAFAALKTDGSVVAWGDANYGGDTSVVQDKLNSGVIAIYNNAFAFVALKSDDSVVVWGHPNFGGSMADGYDSNGNLIYTGAPSITSDNPIQVVSQTNQYYLGYYNVGSIPVSVISYNTSSTEDSDDASTVSEPIVFAPICFPAGTPVLTDQGEIVINKIDPKKHTIRSNKIEGITETVSIEKYVIMIKKNAFSINVPCRDTIISANHKIMFNNQMVQAREFVDKNMYPDHIYKIPYSGYTLYNVLLEDKYDVMVVNNIITETLNPKSINAWLFRKLKSDMSNTERKEVMNTYMRRVYPESVFSSFMVECK